MSRHYITYLISLLSLLALPAFGQDPFKPVATDGDRIVLTTAIERADDITFVIRPIEHGIWVDQNGDGQFQREEMASNPEDDLNDPGHFLVTFQVTSPQITIYGKIDQLIIPDCKMTSVDLTHATALKTLEAYRNEISSVTTSAGLPLEDLWLADNKLQEIDFSNWSKLCFIELYNNQISEQAMTKAFNTLQQAAPVSDPELDIPEPTIQVIDTHSDHEGNVCNVDAVAHARSLGWAVYDLAGDTQNWIGEPYEGSPVGLTPISSHMPTCSRMPGAIRLDALEPHSTITLYDMEGRTLQEFSTSTSSITIPLVAEQSATPYLLTIQSPEGQRVSVKL
ncbi:hypothetical protein [uncultured Porphyromonas sp.]|uniref:hypothetical protein n=1 Tax=uncultured Porphyromonas sp. TaxID=159274 RepID=UPI00260BBBBA|nr:hypothetical protein [uncultured Porphyromonas sp.]